MRTTLRQTLCLLMGAVALMGATACETSSHKSLRTYEYNDQGRAPEQKPKEELDSEYKMVSPGEMVVEPRR